MSGTLHLYYAHGARHFLRMTRLSMLSLLRTGVAAADVLVMTDAPAYFADLGVRTRLLDPGELAAWGGPLDFVHRRKVEAIRHARRENAGRALLFVDSDTWWRSAPPADMTLPRMHKRETRFSPRMLALYQAAGAEAGCPPAEMFNSGLVGIPAALPAALMDDVLTLTDALTLRLPLRMEWLEQYAISAVLARHGPVQETAAEVLHYWYYGKDFADLTAGMEDAAFFALDEKGLREQFNQIEVVRKTLGYRLSRQWRNLRRSFAKRKTQWRAYRARRAARR